jgi:hypothetical protein
MSPPPEIRSRPTKLFELAVHAVRSIRARKQLEAIASDSAVARALLATAADDFGSYERALFAEIEEMKRRLYARADTFLWSVHDPVDSERLPPQQLWESRKARQGELRQAALGQAAVRPGA